MEPYFEISRPAPLKGKDKSIKPAPTLWSWGLWLPVSIDPPARACLLAHVGFRTAEEAVADVELFRGRVAHAVDVRVIGGKK